MFLTSMAIGVSPDTLALLHDVDWTTFEPDPSAAQLDELRNRLVAEIAGYPQGAQDEIRRTSWAEAMITARLAAAPAAPTRTTQQAAPPTTDPRWGLIPTADLLARTTIANESSGLPVEGFPIEGWTRREDMSDDDDDEGEEGGTTEEGYYLLNRDEYLALVIERSPSPDF